MPAILAPRLINNDSWFLLNLGRYALNNGFPRVEPFTLHADFNYVMQQWLSAVMFWLSYEALGQTGLILVAALIYAGMIAMQYQLALTVSGKNHFAAFLTTLASAFFCYLFVSARPYAFSTLIFVLEVLILEKSQANRKPSWLLTLPVLSVLLINFHAALWPMFFVLLGPWYAEIIWLRIRQKNQTGIPTRTLLLTTGLSFLAGFANPYGFKAMTYLFRSLGYPEINSYIVEMQPLNINNPVGIVYLTAIVLVFSLHAYRCSETMPVRHFFLTAGLALMALSAQRSAMLFSALAFYPLAHTCNGLGYRLVKSPGKPSRWLRPTLAGLTVLALILIPLALARPIPKNPTFDNLAEIIEAIKNQADEQTILYTGYDEGGYAEFSGLKPYIDPRAEVFVIANNGQKDVMLEYFKLQTGQLHYSEFLKRYRFTDLLVKEHADLLATYLGRDPNYRMVQQAGDYLWYKRVTP
ncbi:MAG: hypothetical protein EOM08_02595 [Clostridia bacterium]|nr:hypothetical protein [Clostridia bacterium]